MCMNSRWRRDLPARDESWHPTAPVRRNAACASCAGDTAFALAGGAKVRPLSSSAAGLGGHLQSVFFLQVFRRQRRPEVRVTPAYLNEHRLAKLLGVSSVGDSPAVAMLQRFRTPTAIARPHPLGLPIAQPQQLRRLLQPQAARLYPPHDLDTTQLFAAQSTSPQSECLLSKAL